MPVPFEQVAPFLMQGVNMLGNELGTRRQYKYAKKIAGFQHGQNMELMKYQLDYNSPAAQMGRFKDAGLNPNLVYGQGTPGNLESPPRYPDIKGPDFSAVTAQLGTHLQELKLMQSQTGLIDQKTVESGVKKDVMRAQENVLQANPHLNKGYLGALVTLMESNAAMKKQESDFMLSNAHLPEGHRYRGNFRGSDVPVGWLKIVGDIESLGKRFDLMSADQAIKAKVLESKEFQNAILEVQKKWMVDGEVTSQHWWSIIPLVLGLFK